MLPSWPGTFGASRTSFWPCPVARVWWGGSRTRRDGPAPPGSCTAASAQSTVTHYQLNYVKQNFKKTPDLPFRTTIYKR